MAQLKTDPIGQSELIQYLNDCSDFSFEIKVLKSLVDKGFTCEHGGSYTDRVTEKIREFDIRATIQFDHRFLRFAVECKNLRPHFPLLVSCVPRHADESFHELIVSVDRNRWSLGERPEFCAEAYIPKSTSVRMRGVRSLYRPSDPVGKSCDQVGKRRDGEITATDSDVYEKWSQALGSLDDLVCWSCDDGNERSNGVAVSLVFPILVVPDGQLWMTQYDKHGNRIKDPVQVDRCSYLINLPYFSDDVINRHEVLVTHLEFTTVSGLLTFIDELVGDDDKLTATFPDDYLGKQVRLLSV